MKKAGVAELKAHLSEYLRAARSGQEIVICDRDTPVARLVPSEQKGRLVVHRPAPGAPPPGRLKFPAALDLPIDPVELLLEDRRRR